MEITYATEKQAAKVAEIKAAIPAGVTLHAERQSIGIVYLDITTATGQEQVINIDQHGRVGKALKMEMR